MTNPETEPVAAGKQPPRRGHALAWILIFLGILLTVANLYGISEGIFFIVLGAAFLAGYLSNRAYGLLIPAMILMGLGLGIQVADWYLFRVADSWVPFFLGIGFMAIWFVDRITWKQSSTWPLWPGGILVVIGTWVIALETGFFREFWWDFTEIIGEWWPVLLILWGIWLLVRGRSAPSEESIAADRESGTADMMETIPDEDGEPAQPFTADPGAGPLGGGENP